MDEAGSGAAIDLFPAADDCAIPLRGADAVAALGRDRRAGMKLYGYFRSSAAYRVRIALNLKGIAFETLPVNLLKDEHLTPGYRAMHPQGRVPAFDMGGTVLLQSPAILEYLEEIHPEPPLLPSDPIARARVRAIAALIGCDIHPLNNLAVLRYLKRELGQDQAAIDDWYRHWIAEGFSALERMMGDGPFAAGGNPTLADIYLVPQVFNARRLRLPLDPYPRVLAVDAACARLEAFAAAAPDRQPDAV